MFLQCTYRTVERKLYPNAEQSRTLEMCRTECHRAYNRALEQRIKAYKRRGERVSRFDQQLLLTQQRKRMNRLGVVPVEFVRDAFHRVDAAFEAFFRRCKEGQKPGFPRFRVLRRYKSMELQRPKNYFRRGRVSVPCVGEIRSRGRDAAGKQKLLRIIKRADAWYAQVLIETPLDPLPVEPKNAVGIDVGLTSFATLSTGEKIPNPRFGRKPERMLRMLQRRLSRKKRGSRNHAKALKVVVRIHERIKAQRKDFAHQESRKIVNRFDLIGFENLNIAGLARTHFAKSITDAAWGLFLYFVTYKAASAGRHAIAVNPRGTSQECPCCGLVAKKTLSERTHACSCGLVIDRDEAAARVVLARAVAIVAALNLRRDCPLADESPHSLSQPNETGSLAIKTNC